MSAFSRAAQLAAEAAAQARRAEAQIAAGQDAAAVALMDQAQAASDEADRIALASGIPWLEQWAKS
jgi:hypothetical protein